MTIDDLEKNILRDVAVELSDEFDQNFERKAFFTDTWPQSKLTNKKGSLMMRSGKLRRSIKYNITKGYVTFSSSLPYASIHNEGGEITVTEKMKKFFWAMYYKASGAITTKKGGKESNSKRNINLRSEAGQWKALALMKVGQKIKIEKRQFVGDHPQVSGVIENVVTDNVNQLNDYFIQQFKS